jgi:hypothetical protein
MRGYNEIQQDSVRTNDGQSTQDPSITVCEDFGISLAGLPSSIAPKSLETNFLVTITPDTNQTPMQSVNGLSVENQENLQRQPQSEFGRLHETQHRANILALPTELL